MKLGTEAAVENKTSKSTFTVREMIARLALCEDMDAVVSGSMCNSDPIAITDLEEEGDGVITLKLG